MIWNRLYYHLPTDRCARIELEKINFILKIKVKKLFQGPKKIEKTFGWCIELNIINSIYITYCLCDSKTRWHFFVCLFDVWPPFFSNYRYGEIIITNYTYGKLGSWYYNYVNWVLYKSCNNIFYITSCIFNNFFSTE